MGNDRNLAEANLSGYRTSSGEGRVAAVDRLTWPGLFRVLGGRGRSCSSRTRRPRCHGAAAVGRVGVVHVWLRAGKGAKADLRRRYDDLRAGEETRHLREKFPLRPGRGWADAATRRAMASEASLTFRLAPGPPSSMAGVDAMAEVVLRTRPRAMAWRARVTADTWVRMSMQ